MLQKKTKTKTKNPYQKYNLYILIQTREVNTCILKDCYKGFPGGAVVENLPANAGDTGSSPGLGRSHMPRSN